MNRVLVVVVAGLFAGACGGGGQSDIVPGSEIRLTQVPFGATADGTPVDLITLRNGKGIEMKVLTYGGIIMSLKTPDRNGVVDDIVLGHDSVAGYEANSPYFGSLIGRVGNRIANGAFTLDGQAYTLAKNNGPNHLHGGLKGWDKVVWKADPFQDRTGVGVRLEYTSADGEEGYPGAVTAHVVYTLTPDNTLVVDYHATSDKPTIINLTQHSYFNLGGARTTDILGHELTIHADRYTPVDDGLIPTGELAPVDGTPFDFRTATAIGARINTKDTQLEYGLGYDHNYVLTRARAGDGLQVAASVYEPTTGRTLDMATTEPGLQLYTGNFLDGTITGKGGRVYPHRSGFCLETQHFPDSPNHPDFPSIELRPGGEYKSQTVFAFGHR